MLLIDVPHGGDRGAPLSQMFFHNDDEKSFGSSDGSDEETGKRTNVGFFLFESCQIVMKQECSEDSTNSSIFQIVCTCSTRTL